MGRRRKNNDAVLGYMVVFGAIIAAVTWLYDQIRANLEATYMIGGMVLFFGCVVVVARGVRQSRRAEAERLQIEYEESQRLLAEREGRAALVARFGDQMADAIAAREVWHGMTREQLMESWGKPHDISVKVLKTKMKETYKYERIGANRYARRVYLENNIVVGWEI